MTPREQVEWRNEDRLTDYCGQDIKGETIHCPKDFLAALIWPAWAFAFC